MERRLAEIPTEEWSDLHVDVTPREYVARVSDALLPDPAVRGIFGRRGQLSIRGPCMTRTATRSSAGRRCARRDEMIERLASLPPVGSALDQIIHHFGTDTVAEVTGRSRRIVKKTGRDGIDRLAVENRPGSANLAETQSFMDDEKGVLVFSRRRRHRPLAITPISASGTRGCATTICSRPAGAPTTPSRASDGPTAPTRRSRRCSGPWPPM